MQIVTVDNDGDRLSALTQLLKQTFPGCIVTEFTDPLMSAKHILNNRADVVFAAAVMRPADGLQLKNAIQVNKPDIRVLLMAEEDSLPGIRSDADLELPVTKEKLLSVMKA